VCSAGIVTSSGGAPRGLTHGAWLAAGESSETPAPGASLAWLSLASLPCVVSVVAARAGGPGSARIQPGLSMASQLARAWSGPLSSAQVWRLPCTADRPLPRAGGRQRQGRTMKGCGAAHNAPAHVSCRRALLLACLLGDSVGYRCCIVETGACGSARGAGARGA